MIEDETEKRKSEMKDANTVRHRVTSLVGSQHKYGVLVVIIMTMIS